MTPPTGALNARRPADEGPERVAPADLSRPNGDVEPQSSRIDWVHDQLREKILNGELAPGAVLSQAALARELSISRSPIREALRRLESEGLIDARHNQRVQIVELSLADMEEKYAARIVLEVLAIRITVPLLTAEELAAMRDALDLMHAAADARDHDAWSVQHSRFHWVVLSGAGQSIAAQIRQLDEHSRRYRRLYVTQVKTAWEVVLEQDEALLEVIEAGAIDAVAAHWARHLASTALSNIAIVDPTHDPRLIRAALCCVDSEAAAGPLVPSPTRMGGRDRRGA